MELVSKNSLVEVSYERDKKIIHYAFKGSVNVDLATRALEDVLKFSESNEVKGIHCDISELIGTFTMMNDFIATQYFPKLIQQGLVCNSMVVPKDVFAKFATDQLIQKMGGFTIKNFTNADEAYKWVEDSVK